MHMFASVYIFCIFLIVCKVLSNLIVSCSVMWPVAGIKAKVGSSPFIKCASQFPLILWHPYARHHYFCVMTEKEQKKWHAVLQDCVRHSNNGNDTHKHTMTSLLLL